MSGRLWYVCQVEECRQRHLSIRGLINHMRLHHSTQRSMRLFCGLGNCQFIYNTVETYRKHVANKHADYWNGSVVAGSDLLPSNELISEPAMVSIPNGANESSEDELSDSSLMFEGCSTVENIDRSYGTFLNDFGHQLAASHLRAREVYLLPKSTAASIYDDVHSLFDVYDQYIKQQLKSRLTQLGVDFHRDPVLYRILNGDPIYETVTRDISSEYLFKRYLSEKLNYNAPVEVILANNGGKKDVVHYVPLLECVTNYLQHDDVWASCNVSRSQKPGQLTDYTDGDIWRKGGKKDDPLFLRIHLYTDELEICNPIGSKKGVYKLSAFYFLLGNIETRHWSSLNNIHLLLLTKYSNIVKHGLGKVLQPALVDFKKLETEGVLVNVSGHTFTVHGSVVTLSADNLSSHSVGGFNGSFSSGRFCRSCLTTYIDRHGKISEDQCEIRTSDSHKQHVEHVLNDSDVAPVYGVRDQCVLAELEMFDPITSLPPDVMHDIFEGLMPINVEVVIRGLVNAKIITIKHLNGIIESFPYGPSDVSDKPITFPADFVKKRRSSAGKAIEKWCLFRLLTVMIGELIPVDNEFWELHLLCKEICAIILAPVVEEAWISYLAFLISRHHCLLAKLDPAAFKPKVHFLVHYPRLILLYGPLRNLWCMRFEAVHQYFKQMVRRIKNFKNITGTLCERFQMRKCCLHQGSLCLAPSVIITGSQRVLRLESLPNSLVTVLFHKYHITSQSHLISVRQITFESTHYKCGSFIVLDIVHEEDIPLFLQVSYLIHYMGLLLICGKIHVSTRYLPHYDLFVVCENDEWIAVTAGEELSNQMLSSYHINNDMVIGTPFRLCRR